MRSLFLSWSRCHCPSTSSSELYSRKAIRSSRLISNPGCYATNTQSLIAPLLEHLDLSNPPTVFGVSGYSGAGTKASASSGGSNGSGGKPITVPKVTAESLEGGIRPYALTDHIHEREASYHLSRLLGQEDALKVAFIPAVAPWFQGIISTVSAPLKTQMTAKEVKQLYEQWYANEGLYEIRNNVPEIKVCIASFLFDLSVGPVDMPLFRAFSIGRCLTVLGRHSLL